MMCYSVMTQVYSEKEIPSSPFRSRTYDLPITSSDALPLSNRRLVGAKPIKLVSWDMLWVMLFRISQYQNSSSLRYCCSVTCLPLPSPFSTLSYSLCSLGIFTKHGRVTPRQVRNGKLL